MRIGLLSDTHGFLDDAVFSWFSGCHEIWHAGDLGSLDVLESLQRCKPFRGVYGNIDGPEIRSVLPAGITWECEGLQVYMTHIGGHPGRYEPRVRKELERRRPGLFICGHSHILRVVRDRTLGLLHMNPGACGHQGWHRTRTLLRFNVDGGNISGVEAIELGPRGRATSSQSAG